ncbi:SusC/RagA family TonB-linked outer membrane protein [Niabella sp. CJ426]|uniref:SusC/RagA family TonB-linked outer membrane protein n=1 Tax=Niabella sp. CJ426 TaxID=3393740 RepID=UPI003D08C7A0
MRKILLLLAMFMGFSYLAISQTRTVTGTVVDETANPIPFASIAVKGTSSGVSADADGNFSIQAGPGATLVVSATGYTSKEVAANQTSLTVILVKGGNDVIEEVVVTATGQRVNKKTVGYAATVVNSETLVQAAPINAATALSGKVPGLQINVTGSGVNPAVSVVLRGYRSITGNNQALIVLDNVIVPNEMLGNINPNDIESINVLNGSSAAALYGSRASNGALIVTTKKGTPGRTDVRIAQTITASSVAFLPKVQKKFGSGSTGYVKIYDPYENQQYGPAFDGSMVDLGEYPTPGGQMQKVPYTYKEDGGKLDFWKPDVSYQTDLSMSTSGEKGRFYFSGQFVTNEGTIEGDSYKRAAVGLGGTQKIYDNLSIDYSARYTQNYTRQTSAAASLYDLLLNSPGQAPVTSYKNWRRDSFAMPDYYYNAYYNNPYFIKDNNRSLARNEYLVGNIALKWAPLTWLDIVGKAGMTSRNYSGKTWSDKYIFSTYAKGLSHGSYKKSDILGGVSENLFYTNTLVGDFQAMFKKTNIENWDFKLNLGTQLIQDDAKDLSANINGLALPGIFNLSNLTTTWNAGEGISQARTIGVYGELYATYKKLGATLHVTGRRDHVSVLDPGFNTFFYPSADLAVVLSDAIPALKNNRNINLLKIRGGISNVGNVNLGPYSTEPTVGQGAGYPYNGIVSYTIGDRLVQKGLKPEFTLGREIGFEFEFFRKVSGEFTYYVNETKNQTLPVSIATSSGYSGLLTNVGLTRGAGVEATLNVKVLQTDNFSLAVGGNYTYNDNKIVDLGIQDIDRLARFTFGNGSGVYAAEGLPFPAYFGTTHVRDSASGKVIVDAITGLPTVNTTIKYLGNTQPRHRAGVNLDVEYKGINLRVLAEYRGGYIMYAGAGPTYDFSGSGINTALFDRERFVFPNSVYKDPATGQYVDNTNVTIADGNVGYWTQDQRRGITENYIVSGDFWKLREVSLSYNLPKYLFSNSRFIKGAAINLIGRNLLILVPKENVYAADPEYSDNGTGNNLGISTLSQNPPTRFYGATISVNF